MAAALIAAGAMLHTLGDLGAPARVRGDGSAQLEPLGGGPDDLGSRFERIAALAFGRLGVPAPARIVTRLRLRDFFTAPLDSKDGAGLADEVAATFFSPGTLPSASRVDRRRAPQAARARCRRCPARPLNLTMAGEPRRRRRSDTATGVVPRATPSVEHDVLSFSPRRRLHARASVTEILPEVAAY